ncbi:TetR family transcriptional regulator, partial [Pseudomonas umsongensis]|uniref:TetR family transcriptional regulator n=1 Tax=Pseudomonas umsongensis TaxID=198618 RepID=UPI00200B160B
MCTEGFCRTTERRSGTARGTGVARSTFYAHFRDKEDLIVAGYEAIGMPSTKVTEVGGDRRVLLDVSAWLFSATERHAALTTSFFSGPGQS